jgi:hypothetical protein
VEGCASVTAYAEATKAITHTRTIGPKGLVLVRPSDEPKVIEEGKAALARAESGRPTTERLRQLGAVLRGQVETKGRLLEALRRRDEEAYVAESARWGRDSQQVLDMWAGINADCRTDLSRPPGRLEPAVIQERVRAQFDQLRGCYEAGLGRNPNLTGRISIRFVIDRTGSVKDVEVRTREDVSSSDPEPGTEPFFEKLGFPRPPANPVPLMSDQGVLTCVADRFRALIFPPPTHGIVTVVYPILFAPG